MPKPISQSALSTSRPDVMGCAANPIEAGVWTGRDNALALVLIADGQAVADLSGVTRAVVDLDGSQVVDSDLVGAGVIWWNEQESYRGALVDVLKLRLGGQGLTPGVYQNVEVVVYDGNNPNGLIVETGTKITVHA